MVAAVKSLAAWDRECPPPDSVRKWTEDHRELGHMGLRDDGPSLGTVCGYYEEQPGVDIIPEREWAKWVEEIDFEHRANRIAVANTLDQDGRGSCASESGASALYAARAAGNQPFVELNPWGVYGRKEISGGLDGGSNIRDNLVYFRDIGCPPESVHPRSKGWRASLSEKALEARKHFRIGEFHQARSLDGLATAVIRGHRVMGGYTGHAICFYGLEKRGGIWYVKYHNSWGKGWNGNGRGSLRMSKVYLNYGLYVVRTAIESTWTPA